MFQRWSHSTLYVALKKETSNVNLNKGCRAVTGEMHNEVGDKTLPLLDIADGTLRFGGKEGIYQKTIATFLEDFASTVDKITSVFDGDEEQIARAVHSLKGVSGTLAASRLYVFCLETEEYCNCNRSAELQQRLQHITTLLTATKVRMEEYLSLKTQNLSPVTPQSGSADLEPFKEALKHNNAAAVKLFDEIKPMLLTRMDPVQFGRLSLSINQFNFEDALTILSDLT